MLFRNVFSSAAIFFIAQHINADIIDHKKDNQASPADTPGHMSLPSLFELESIDELKLNWETYNGIRLDTGRLLFENGPGSVWSTPQLANTRDEWTIETTFRLTPKNGDSNIHHDQSNGLAFWLINPSNTDPIDDRNVNNYGGPSQFDGFQFLMNNKDETGLKIFANDGSKVLLNSLSDSIGNCGFNFLQSDIPYSIRVSYSKQRNWFKVQVDNNLCFKTNAIVLPDEIDDFKFGVSANIGDTSEFFELFGINVWSHLTSDAIDDHGLINSGQVKVDADTVVVKDKSDNFVPPSYIRESLMERTRRQQEEIAKQQSNGLSNDGLKEISQKLAQVEQSINNIKFGDGSSAPSYDIKVLETYIQDIKNVQSQQSQILSDLQQSYTDFKSTITQQYSQMLSAVSKLNEKVIGEVREHQFSMEEVGKKVDLLMANHKEISHQYQNQQPLQIPKTDYPGTIVKWILIIIFASILVLTLVIYRLRHDIKHSKLL